VELLIVEDETKVADFLKRSLEAEGHVVRACGDLGELGALLTATVEQGSTSPDAIVLDRMLRGEDGLDSIPRLKRRFPACRILVLSAIDLPEEKARALDLGADDYLAKPFSLTELSARLRVLGRRRKDAGISPLIQVRDLTVDITLQTVAVGGRRVELSKKEYQVLVLLAQSPGRVFNKFQLLDKVWDMQFSIESNTVEATIRNLRRKLQDAGSELEILSKRNVGYWVES
jgi:two-component system copper resistance phosphate regulon response regulator CusR